MTFEKSRPFTRGLTLDLLARLEPDALLYSPSVRLGALWKQFRHVGRVHENYVEALETGRIRFELTDTYRGGPSGEELSAYLRSVDERMRHALTSVEESPIAWDGETISRAEHLERLVAHETLHHGQWVVYVRLLGGSFPSSWAAWGL